MVYPERSRVWVMDADGMQVQEAPKELPWTENAADVLPNYPFISGMHVPTISPLSDTLAEAKCHAACINCAALCRTFATFFSVSVQFPLSTVESAPHSWQ